MENYALLICACLSIKYVSVKCSKEGNGVKKTEGGFGYKSRDKCFIYSITGRLTILYAIGCLIEKF